jgi:hypothetical protein
VRRLATLADHVLNTPASGETAPDRARQDLPACASPSAGGEVTLHDPAALLRLGDSRQHRRRRPHGLDGLHFHRSARPTATRSNAPSRRSREVRQFIPHEWSTSGGHHITRPDYDVIGSSACHRVPREVGKPVYLSPGAVALGTGVLVSTVMDTFVNGMPSRSQYLGDRPHARRTQMPYRPVIVGAGIRA